MKEYWRFELWYISAALSKTLYPANTLEFEQRLSEKWIRSGLSLPCQAVSRDLLDWTCGGLTGQFSHVSEII